MRWRIVRWLDVPERQALIPQLDEIFFEASATRSFSDEAARLAFRERWLGRYLDRFPQWFYVVVAGEAGSQSCALGYLAGCLDDPAQSQLFADIAYFGALQDLTARFPAHLHINLAADVRGQRIGQALVERFCEDVRASGGSGVHVVTSARSRNVSFYNRCGFADVRRFASGSVENVMLAKRLS